MKFYIAHNYAVRDILAFEIKPILETKGHIVTSEWLTQKHEDRDIHKQRAYAETDLYNIMNADALILFTDQFGERPGKGKFIEFGAAHCMNKKIFVIGEDCEGSVFYFLGGVNRFKTFIEFIHWLDQHGQST